jgi:hypothetical protein
MPITGQGWELHIVRKSTQTRNVGKSRIRTVGTYQVFHEGLAQSGPGMAGTMAESKGPGKNAPAGNGRRIEAGRYPLSTQDGAHYTTWKFEVTENIGKNPKPGFLVLNTNQRVGILVHPGKNSFLSSVGCFNPCTSLPKASEIIDYKHSRARVIAMIEDMKAFIGNGFPNKNGRKIPNAFIVIDGEPL